jgi:hypothetical protein
VKIIKAADRFGEPRGVKALIVGPTGIGKTWLHRTINSTTALFVDIEAGDLAIGDLDVDTLRPRTWPECRDIAVLLAGANPSVPADAVYSKAHYEAVVHEVGEAWPFDRYSTYFIDSLTAAGRLCSLGQANSRRHFLSAVARRISEEHTDYTRERCAPG